MILSKGRCEVYFSDAAVKGKPIVKAKPWHRRSFVDVLFHAPFRGSCLWLDIRVRVQTKKTVAFRPTG